MELLSPMKFLQPRPFKAELFDSRNFNRLFMEDPDFRTFARQVYSYLDNMRPGKMLRLDRYSGQKLEWIILTTVAFMDEGIHSVDYCFTDDYSAIVHFRVDEETLEKFRSAKYGRTAADSTTILNRTKARE